MKVDKSRQMRTLQNRAKEGEGRVESTGLGERRPQTNFSAYSLNTKTSNDTTQSIT
jgi:hypothetical protein